MKLRVLSFLSLIANPAAAATVTWDQPNADNTWNTTTANWSAGATFANGDAAIFNSATGETVTVDAGGVAPVSTTISNNGNWTFTGGAIGGTLAKGGSGALELGTGANGFTAVSIAGGPNTQGTGAVRMAAVAGGYSGLGSGAITLGNTGDMTAFFFTGSGTLANDIALTTNSGRITRFSGTGNAGRTTTLSGLITGGNAASEVRFDGDTAAGTGVFNLTNASNSFAGTLHMWRGALAFTSDGALGAAGNDLNLDVGASGNPKNTGLMFNANGIVLNSGRTLTFTSATVVDTQAFTGSQVNGAMVFNAQMVKRGSTVLTLNGSGSGGGGISVLEGSIKLGNSGAMGSGTLTLGTTGNSILDTSSLAGSQTIANNIALTNPAAAANLGIVMKGGSGNSLTLGGVISGGGANATLFLNNDASGDNAARFILANANTYSGKTYINRGSVQLNHAAGFGTSAVQFDSNANAVLSFGSSMTVANDISYTYAAKKVDTGASDIVFSGIQTFGQAVTKDGSGTLALTRGNGGSAGVTVASGTLLANNTSGSATGTGTVTVSSSGTLGGTGAIAGAVNASGTLSPGDGSMESLATGNLSLTSGSTFKYEAADAGAAGADLLVAGSLSVSGATLDLSGANLDQGLWSLGDKLTLISYTGSAITSGFNGFLDDTTYTYGGNSWLFDYNDSFKGANFASEATGSYHVTMTLSAIPEPTSALAGGLCLAGLLRRRRPRRTR